MRHKPLFTDPEEQKIYREQAFKAQKEGRVPLRIFIIEQGMKKPTQIAVLQSAARRKKLYFQTRSDWMQLYKEIID